MKDLLGKIFMGLVFVLALTVIFVKAGTQTPGGKGVSGGQQAADIINAAGSAGSNLAQGATGG